MRYPPRLRRILPPTQKDWVTEEGTDLPEEVPADPGMSVVRDYDFIHFDLDPKNSKYPSVHLSSRMRVLNCGMITRCCPVFIGMIGDEGHRTTHKFKVSTRSQQYSLGGGCPQLSPTSFQSALM